MENILHREVDNCPVRKSLAVIGGKWRLLIIGQFFENNTLRNSDLKRAIPEISEKMLNQELRHLVSNNILEKKSYPVIPPKVEYTLTEIGQDAMPFIQQLALFGQKLE